MKKYLLGVIALALAMGFSAFTTDFHSRADKTFFKYTGTTPDGYTDASNWDMSSDPIPGCSGGESTCTVSSTEFTSTQDLADYLETVHQDPQTSVTDIYQITNQQLQLEEQE